MEEFALRSVSWSPSNMTNTKREFGEKTISFRVITVIPFPLGHIVPHCCVLFSYKRTPLQSEHAFWAGAGGWMNHIAISGALPIFY